MIRAAALVLLLLDAGEKSSGFDPAACGLLRTIAPLGGELYGAVFSPDGSRLAVGTLQSVRLFETYSGREAGRLEGHPQHVSTVAWSRDGARVAAGGFEGGVQVWDVATLRPLRTLQGRGTRLTALAFSPDGRRLFSGAQDGGLRVWELAEGGRDRDLPGRAGAVTDVAFAGDRALSTGADGRVHVWKTDPWELERSIDLGVPEARGAAFSPDGRRVALIGGDVLLAGAATGGLRRMSGIPEGALCRPLLDGRHAVYAAGPRGLRIADLQRGKVVAELQHHLGEATSIALHPGGRIFATSGQDRHLKLWGPVPGGMSGVRPKGFLGVMVQQDAAGSLFLANIVPGTAAETAGLKMGDLLRRVGGRTVETPIEATDQIGSFQEGQEVEFLIERGGEERTLRIRLGRRP